MSQYIEVQPSEVLDDMNIRFGLKPSRVDELAAEIEEQGGVLEPLRLERLETPSNGHLYRIQDGHYRKAAVDKLNSDKNAGLLLPAILVETKPPVERLLTQLSANWHEEMSPMDCARAIKLLMDAGYPRVQIRQRFTRPASGKKGKKEASNAWVNMMVRFLEFPKAIQTKIHAGEAGGGIGVATAYELYRKPKEKWEEILAEAESQRKKAIELEDKEEEKYLADVAKEEKRKAVEKQDAEALAKAKEEHAKAIAATKELATKAGDAFKTAKEAKAAADKDAQVKAEKELKELEEQAKNAEKAAAEAKRIADKLEAKVKTDKEKADERAKKLKDAQTAAKKKLAPGPAEIKKAAKKVAPATDGKVPLTWAEVKKLIHDQATLPGGTDKGSVNCQKVFQEIEACMLSTITEGVMVKNIRALWK